jgi:predicted dehydrogenase
MKIGVVGCGMISGHHLRAATTYPGAVVVGIVDRDSARAREQAQRFGIGHTFDDIAQLLALKPDVVHVLTPPASHSALVIEALEAGAHVYVEKPMGRSVAECELMSAAAQRANRQLCVGHNWLYTPGMLSLQALLETGTPGKVLQASAAYSYDVRRNPNFNTEHWAKSLPGGLAEDLAVHPMALLIRVLGSPVQMSAMSYASTEVQGGKDSDARLLVKAERGLGTMSVSIRARPDMALLDVWCERMLLRLNVSSMTLTSHRELPFPRMISRGLANFDIAAQLVSSTVSTTWKLLRKQVDGSYGIVPLVHAFYAAIKANRPTPVSAREGSQAVAALRALWPIRADG